MIEFVSELSREHFLRWIDSFFTKTDSIESNSEANNDNRYVDNNDNSLITITSDDTLPIQGQKLPKQKRKIKLVSCSTKNEILKEAETKERRQEKLDQFFREAYALTFGIK